MLKRYIKLASIDCKGDRFLFRGLVSTKSGQKLRESGSISYIRFRELVLEKQTAIGIDSSLFGLHSFCSDVA